MNHSTEQKLLNIANLGINRLRHLFEEHQEWFLPKPAFRWGTACTNQGTSKLPFDHGGVERELSYT